MRCSNISNWHGKGLQNQKGVGPLVSSQKRRARFVSRINRSSNAVFVPPSVYIRTRLFELPNTYTFRTGVFDALGVSESVVLWADRSVRVTFCQVPPHPAASLRCAPPRFDPPVVSPGYGLDRFEDAPEGFQGGFKPNPKPFQGGG